MRKSFLYNPELKARARQMRNEMTAAEKKLWYDYLRQAKYRWLRQKPIGNFIVDFYCAELKLVIEVDGATHLEDRDIDYNKKRTKELEKLGLKVLRFWNDDIFNGLNEVINIIQEEIPLPPLLKGARNTMTQTLKIILITLVALTALLIAASRPAAAATINQPRPLSGGLQTGLIGWWTFDSGKMKTNVADSSGQNNNGYLTGFTSTSSATVVGKLGQALKFDGVNDYAQTSATGFDFERTDPFTISAWIKRKPNGTSPAILGRIDQGGGGYRGYSIWINDSTEVWGNANSVTLEFISTAVDYIDVLTPLNSFNSNNQWQHVVATSQGDLANAKIYINGVSQPTSPTGTLTGTTKNSLNLRIGDDYTSIMMNGSLDDVRIYNRALSAAEVQQLYNGGTAKINQSLAAGAAKSQLVGWWTFDSADMKNNVADKSGTGNNGYMTGFTSTSSATVIGKIGQALKFDGVNDYVDAGHLTNLESGDYTISLWAKFNSLSARWLVNQWSNVGGVPKGPALFINSPGGLYFEIGAYANVLATATGILTIGPWYHIVVSAQGTTLSIYKNGAQVVQGTRTRTESDATQHFRISDTTHDGVSPFWGSMDDVRIYSRALSANEIRQLYNDGTAKVNQSLAGINSGLVGWWTFDSGKMKTNVADSSGQNNNGYMSGFTSTSSATVIGKIGQGLKFDGRDDYVDLANESNFDFERTSSFTLSAWIKPNVVASNEILAKFTSGSTRPGWNLMTNSSNNLQVFLNSNYGAGNYIDVNGGTSLSPNVWYYITVAYNGTSAASGIKIYVNSILETNAINTDNLSGSILNNVNARIANWGGNNTMFNGLMDDVRIYNRALSQSEITRLYNLGR